MPVPDGTSARGRAVRIEENIIFVQEEMVAGPTKFTHRLSVETNTSQGSLVRILHCNFGMKPYPLQILQQPTNADKQTVSAPRNGAHEA
ncbi:hypothetical protein Trydic_g20884 [Trypoxylus dichotomus]